MEILPRDSEFLYLQQTEEDLKNKEIAETAKILSKKWLEIKDGICPLCEGKGLLRLSFNYMDNHKIVCEACHFSWVDGNMETALDKAYNWIDNLLMKGQRAQYHEKRHQDIEKSLEIGDWGTIEQLKKGIKISNMG